MNTRNEGSPWSATYGSKRHLIRLRGQMTNDLIAGWSADGCVIRTGVCPVTKRQKQTTDCANCRYNRVVNYNNFYHNNLFPSFKNKTAGTVCIAPC